MSSTSQARASRPADLAGQDEVNDLLWECAAYVELIGEAALADAGLTLASSGTLAAVLAEPGITIAEIARRKPKSQQAVSQVVARLEKLGLLERRLGPGRGVGLYLTDAGRAKAKLGLRREAEMRSGLRELIGDERYDELARVLGETRTILREAR